MAFLRTVALALALLGSQAWADHVPMTMTARAAERDGAEARVMRAIRRTADKRGFGGLEPRTGTFEFDYVDESSLVESSPYVATLTIKPPRPALALEDLEDLLSSVQCSSQGISLTFASGSLAKRARQAWSAPEFIVFTSHKGCNNDGERIPYMVSGVSFDDHRDSAMLSAKPISWDKASKAMSLDFGSRQSCAGLDIRSYQTGAELLARDDDLITQDLSFSYVDDTLFSVPNIVTQKCQRCVGTGNVSLATGHVEVKDEFANLIGDIFNPGQELKDIAQVFSAADVSIVFDGFGAEFLFETDINLDQNFTYHLLPSPLTFGGLSLPGLFTLGASFDPVIVASMHTEEPLAFTYGFEFAVPDGSAFDIDMVDISASQKTGFDQTTFTPLPFSAGKFTPTLDLSLEFRPVVSLGVSLLSIQLDPVIVFADIPKFEATIALLLNADDNCQALSAGETADGVHVLLTGDFALDLGVGMDIGAIGALEFNPSVILAQVTLFPFSTCFGGHHPLPTAGGPVPTLPAAYTSVVTVSPVPADATATATASVGPQPNKGVDYDGGYYDNGSYGSTGVAGIYSGPSTTAAAATVPGTTTAPAPPAYTTSAVVVTSITACPLTLTQTAGNYTTYIQTTSTSTIFYTSFITAPAASTIFVIPLPAFSATATPLSAASVPCESTTVPSASAVSPPYVPSPPPAVPSGSAVSPPYVPSPVSAGSTSTAAAPSGPNAVAPTLGSTTAAATTAPTAAPTLPVAPVVGTNGTLTGTPIVFSSAAGKRAVAGSVGMVAAVVAALML